MPWERGSLEGNAITYLVVGEDTGNNDDEGQHSSEVQVVLSGVDVLGGLNS